MTFDWERFFERSRIETSQHGASKGNTMIRCPWCGASDQSHHLAVSTEDKGYRCFRSKSHSGRSVPRLIQALLDCSWPEALRLAGFAHNGLRDGDLRASAKALRSGPSQTAQHRLRSVGFPVEFRPLGMTGSGRAFAEYLIGDRGYDPQDLAVLAQRYNLHTTIAGPFKYRLIFPVYMNGRLVNWTGRAIYDGASLRYRTLSADAEKAAENGLPQAALSIEQTLWNYDNLTGGEELYVVEGPFDAMRLDYFGFASDIHATCTYTKSVSDTQLSLLEGLRRRYHRLTRVLDEDAMLDLLGESTRMAHLGCGSKKLPAGLGDPAQFTRNAALEFMGA